MSKKNLKGILIALTSLIIIIAAMAVIYANLGPKGVKGKKEIVLEVIVPEKESKEITVNTDAEFLSQALEEDKLIKGSEGDYGLMVTEVNGITADSSNWWCLTKDGVFLNTGVDTTPIRDGDHFEFTLTPIE